MVGISSGFNAVRGISHAGDGHGAVVGINDNATPGAGPGVFGQSAATGVWGQSTTWMGVFGFSESTTGGNGVMGRAVGGGAGTVGEATTGIGVLGITDSGEAAIRGDHKGDGFAGFFNGNVGVSRDLRVNGHVQVMGDVQLIGADLAEQFGVVGDEDVEAGSVVVFAGEDRVRMSDAPYDRRVAGVVSGAGSYRPGLILDRQDGRERLPLALVGKVWCKVDADCGPVALGDMLTTSSTPGHAMRAADPARAFGAVIGKALGSLQSGRALVPVLVALQ